MWALGLMLTCWIWILRDTLPSRRRMVVVAASASSAFSAMAKVTATATALPPWLTQLRPKMQWWARPLGRDCGWCLRGWCLRGWCLRVVDGCVSYVVARIGDDAPLLSVAPVAPTQLGSF